MCGIISTNSTCPTKSKEDNYTLIHVSESEIPCYTLKRESNERLQSCGLRQCEEELMEVVCSPSDIIISVVSDDKAIDDTFEPYEMAGSLATIAAVLFISITLAYAQVPALGPCPDIETMQNFNMQRYLGQWYEAERYFALFEFAGKCVTANYTDLGDGRINIINRQMSSLTGIRSTIEGEVRLVGRSDESKLSVKFPSLPVLVDAPYWVLGSDYDNYSVVWSCTNFGLFSTRNAWILTRNRHPTLEVMEQAYSVVDKHGISRAYFIRTDQKNCPTILY